MDFPLAAAVASTLIVRASSSSTNAELAEIATQTDAPDLTTVVTRDQTAGRGRLDRRWIAPAGAGLAISVLVRRPGTAIGWLPLLAGVAMTDAVAPLVPLSAGLKWPNDVLVGGRKTSGILAEVLPSGDVVVGAGLNVEMAADQLPVATATSLVVAGADSVDLADRALAAYLREFFARLQALRASAGDPESSGLRAAARERCVTLGREVRIELPGGGELQGYARDIDRDGRLVVDVAGRATPVAAGDVIHVR